MFYFAPKGPFCWRSDRTTFFIARLVGLQSKHRVKLHSQCLDSLFFWSTLWTKHGAPWLDSTRLSLSPSTRGKEASRHPRSVQELAEKNDFPKASEKSGCTKIKVQLSKTQQPNFGKLELRPWLISYFDFVVLVCFSIVTNLRWGDNGEDCSIVLAPICLLDRSSREHSFCEREREKGNARKKTMSCL